MNSLFDILTETIFESTILEVVEDKNNPLEKEEQSGVNHYIDKTPDEGWNYFWRSWNEFSDEDFETEFGKSKESYKQEFANQVRTAKQDAVKYYKDYYSEKNPDVIEKFKKHGILSLPGNTLDTLHTKLDKISDNDDTHILHYTSGKEPGKRKVGKSLSTAWGFVVTPKEEMHILLYNFVNPDITSWKDTLYGVIVHELGHIISNILKKRRLKPYKKVKVEDIFNKKDKDDGDKYIMTDIETYARLQNLRRHLNITSNLTPEEFVSVWMDKIQKEEIKLSDKVALVHPNMPEREEKFCCSGCDEEELSPNTPKWSQQETTVTLEIPLEYAQICVCEKIIASKDSEKCKSKDLNFKNRTQLSVLWSNLTYNGKKDVDIDKLLAKFTSKVTKTKDKFYLSIDFKKIAYANEEFVQNEIGDDLDTQTV